MGPLSLQPFAPAPDPAPFEGARQPTAPARLPPGLLSVDRPPFDRRRQALAAEIVALWQPPPDQPQPFLGGRQPYQPPHLPASVVAVHVTSDRYTIPVSHRVHAGRVAPLALNVTWSVVGQFENADFLANPDFLGLVDFLGASATELVSGFPEYRLTQDGTTWGPWIKYSPGVYLAEGIDLSIVLNAPSGLAYAVCTAFSFTVDVPDRTDFYANQATSSSADTTITFAPAPFNGGPGAASVPSVLETFRDAQAGDDFIITAISLTAVTFKVLNGGVRVVRHLDLTVQGY